MKELWHLLTVTDRETFKYELERYYERTWEFSQRKAYKKVSEDMNIPTKEHAQLTSLLRETWNICFVAMIIYKL